MHNATMTTQSSREQCNGGRGDGIGVWSLAAYAQQVMMELRAEDPVQVVLTMHSERVKRTVYLVFSTLV